MMQWSVHVGDTNEIALIPPQLNFNNKWPNCVIGCGQASTTQHDLLEMACFLQASRAGKAAGYYKSVLMLRSLSTGAGI